MAGESTSKKWRVADMWAYVITDATKENVAQTMANMHESWPGADVQVVTRQVRALGGTLKFRVIVVRYPR